MGTVNKVYILHGWAYSTEKWSSFNKLLEEAGFKSIQLKIPGLTEEVDRAWCLDDYVEWLKEKLTEDKVILIGHSNGGRIALAFAVKYPERLQQLILIDSAGIYHNEWPLRLKRFVFGKLAAAGKTLTSSESLRKLFYKLVREKDYLEAPLMLRETMANLIRVNLEPELAKVETPTLIIWGRCDTQTPVSDAFLMHQSIKNSKLFIVEEARHSPQFTHTSEVCERILSEIKK